VSRPPSRSAIGLCALTVLFGIRVVGQALVALFDVAWLPSMDAWFSGLLPYPMLLPIQLVILLVQAVIDRGFFTLPRPRAGRALQWFASVYALSMVVRYVVTRSHPIPIVFHWVLAAYLFTLGRVMRPPRHDASASSSLRGRTPGGEGTGDRLRLDDSGAVNSPS